MDYEKIMQKLWKTRKEYWKAQDKLEKATKDIEISQTDFVEAFNNLVEHSKKIPLIKNYTKTNIINYITVVYWLSWNAVKWLLEGKTNPYNKTKWKAKNFITDRL